MAPVFVNKLGPAFLPINPAFLRNVFFAVLPKFRKKRSTALNGAANMAPNVILKAFAASAADNVINFLTPMVATRNMLPIVSKSTPSFLLNS